MKKAGNAEMERPDIILHVDMDAFYAAVELLDHPEWRGRPLVVGAPPDRRGVVSTASYEARAYGIHSAMPSRTAGKLCPHAIFLPVRMERYVEVSRRVMEILGSFTPVLEQVSVDEAFLDLRGSLRRGRTGRTVAEALKTRIREELKLTASVGVAPNKFLAKLASDLGKPDGLMVVPGDPAAIAALLAPLPVSRIWGVGRVTEARLRECGLRTIGDVQRASPAALAAFVGRGLAEHMHDLAFGRDDRPVVTFSEAKSVSNEVTFDVDCRDAAVIRQTLVELAEQVGARLRADGKRARVGHLKLRFEDFRTITRQQRFPRATNRDRDLIACAAALLAREQRGEPVRLVGFGVSHLDGEGAEQAELGLNVFPREPDAARVERLDRAVDAVRRRFGESALTRASRLGGAAPRRVVDG